jgi:GNAT superfamily N-acetyltransferase
VITIQTATAADASAIWSILKPVFRAGETYTIRRDIDEADAIAYWCGRNHETFVAEEEGNILGTYYLRANQAGGGDHVANCGYMTSSQAQGRGIARLMLEHSLVRAQERGFRAMQFNFVVREWDHRPKPLFEPGSRPSGMPPRLLERNGDSGGYNLPAAIVDGPPCPRPSAYMRRNNEMPALSVFVITKPAGAASSAFNSGVEPTRTDGNVLASLRPPRPYRPTYPFHPCLLPEHHGHALRLSESRRS